jgi:thiamine monophosphate kinase
MSKVGFIIDKIPSAPEVKRFSTLNDLDAADLALYGGEEYELGMTVKPEKWEDAKALVESC